MGLGGCSTIQPLLFSRRLEKDLLEADAPWIVRIKAVTLAANVSGPFIQPDSLRLQDACFELDGRILEQAGVSLQLMEKEPANSVATGGRGDVHPLDLGDFLGQGTQCPTADWAYLILGNQENGPRLPYIGRAESQDAAVVTVEIGELCCKCAHERYTSGRLRVRTFDDNVGSFLHACP